MRANPPTLEELENALKRMETLPAMLDKAEHTRDVILPIMARVRAAGDALEVVTGADYWPMPTYQEILTSV